MNLPKLTESIVRAAAEAKSFARGQELYERGAISNTVIQERLLIGECEGTQEPYYRVQVELDEAGIRVTHCTCPYDFGGVCKHTVALLLTWVHHPKQFAVRQEPSALLADLDREALVALLERLIRDYPELYASVEAAITTPQTAGKRKKKRRKTVDPEIYRRQVIGILHSLDGMRASEAYWHVEGLTDQLRQVEQSANKFLDAGDAETALEILMALVEEGGHGVEYIDDSNGYFGDYMSSLRQPLAEVISIWCVLT